MLLFYLIYFKDYFILGKKLSTFILFSEPKKAVLFKDSLSEEGILYLIGARLGYFSD